MGKVLVECEMGVFAAVGPFSDELIVPDYEAAVERLKTMTGIEAAQLILATVRRNDAVVDDDELDGLAEALGVFADND